MPMPSGDVRLASPADFDACRTLLRGGSRTFFAASFLLQRKLRDPATALYAFCRLADDAVDLDANAATALGRLRDRLARAYDGHPLPTAADRAFADVVRHFDMPRALPAALLEGFAWDAAGQRYEEFSALCSYAVRVAGTVGAMMAVLMRRRSHDCVARACDLGVAMQFTNIARDVGEDARAGRLYLPLQWLRDEGVDPDAWLGRPAFEPAIGRVVRRMLDAADVFYQRAESGIARLPLACRPGIRAARLLYAEIGHEVARSGYDSISRRARVPARRKAELLLRALTPLRGESETAGFACLAEAQFLVDALGATPRPQPAPRAPAPNIADRLVWVVELFDRLERAQRGRP